MLHGGGFSLGSRASHDAVARRLAIGTGADVVSVEYRLAPEHVPTASDDALDAWRHVVDAAPHWGVRADKIVVAGDSAGPTSRLCWPWMCAARPCSPPCNC